MDINDIKGTIAYPNLREAVQEVVADAQRVPHYKDLSGTMDEYVVSVECMQNLFKAYYQLVGV